MGQCTAPREVQVHNHHAEVPSTDLRECERTSKKSHVFRESSRKHTLAGTTHTQKAYSARKHIRSHVVKRKEGIAGAHQADFDGCYHYSDNNDGFRETERPTERQRFFSKVLNTLRKIHIQEDLSRKQHLPVMRELSEPGQLPKYW